MILDICTPLCVVIFVENALHVKIFWIRLVYTECLPSTCPCGDLCSNQRIQKLEWNDSLEKFLTTNRGYGVKTSQSLPAGDQSITHDVCLATIYASRNYCIEVYLISFSSSKQIELPVLLKQDLHFDLVWSAPSMISGRSFACCGGLFSVVVVLVFVL